MAESSLQEQLQNINTKKPRVAPEVQKEEVRHELISQDNALTQSRYDFSPTEKNVLYRIIQKVRHDYVEGCETSPVGYLEGVSVHEAYRHQGIVILRALNYILIILQRARQVNEKT